MQDAKGLRIPDVKRKRVSHYLKLKADMDPKLLASVRNALNNAITEMDPKHDVSGSSISYAAVMVVDAVRESLPNDMQYLLYRTDSYQTSRS